MLERFAECAERLGGMANDEMFLNATHWIEKNAQTDGTIRRDTGFVMLPSEFVLSGPHFFVGNPLNKSPRSICTKNSHYDVIDLSLIPDDYVPCCNYRPDCDDTTYANRVPRVTWKEGEACEYKLFSAYYRLITRRGLSLSGERTLLSAIAPRGFNHIDGVFSVTLKDVLKTATLTGLWSSIPFDFFVKSSGKGDFRNNAAGS